MRETSQHLSDGKIRDFISRKLPPSDVLRVDDHLAACDICMRKAEAYRSANGIRESISRGAVDEHLTYEQMAGFVDATLTDPDREIVEVHQQACKDCSAEIANLRNLRDELAASTTTETLPKQTDSSWLTRLLANRYLRIAVPAFGIIVLAAIIWLSESGVNHPVTEVNAPPIASPSIGNERATTVNDVNPNVDNKRIVASLNDAGGKIEMDDKGVIAGLLAGELEPKVRVALKDQTVEIPADLRQLKTSTGVLMGAPENGVPFKVSSPVGRVVESQRPTFSWQPLKDATVYKVGLYDDKFNEVAVSTNLRSTTWTPDKPLKRGQIYQWQVTAVRGSEEVKSPVRPAPEAKFKVVDEANFSEIEKARRTNSHLALGIAYANAGLVDDAEREFEILLKNNPRSDIARKLLAKVRSQR